MGKRNLLVPVSSCLAPISRTTGDSQVKRGARNSIFRTLSMMSKIQHGDEIEMKVPETHYRQPLAFGIISQSLKIRT
ncbi:hypothetical protein KIN20_020530 [Parelaphostrongylus tenuis]|uniref:Uncharacterized protein n=1 Tax=Parelaphostrongylus tenuis TaxID=148309 RepID=A0AAD5MRE0_PARTN|nr:hypothetical protein KIN20_020530 [Parelaphostrongylus tenuis]